MSTEFQCVDKCIMARCSPLVLKLLSKNAVLGQYFFDLSTKSLWTYIGDGEWFKISGYPAQEKSMINHELLKDFSFSNDYIEITKTDIGWHYKIKNIHPNDKWFVKTNIEFAHEAYRQCLLAAKELNNERINTIK